MFEVHFRDDGNVSIFRFDVDETPTRYYNDRYFSFKKSDLNECLYELDRRLYPFMYTMDNSVENIEILRKKYLDALYNQIDVEYEEFQKVREDHELRISKIIQKCNKINKGEILK